MMLMLIHMMLMLIECYANVFITHTSNISGPRSSISTALPRMTRSGGDSICNNVSALFLPSLSRLSIFTQQVRLLHN